MMVRQVIQKCNGTEIFYFLKLQGIFKVCMSLQCLSRVDEDWDFKAKRAKYSDVRHLNICDNSSNL